MRMRLKESWISFVREWKETKSHKRGGITLCTSGGIGVEIMAQILSKFEITKFGKKVENKWYLKESQQHDGTGY